MQDLNGQVFDQKLALNLAAFFVFHRDCCQTSPSESDFGWRCNNSANFIRRLRFLRQNRRNAAAVRPDRLSSARWKSGRNGIAHTRSAKSGGRIEKELALPRATPIADDLAPANTPYKRSLIAAAAARIGQAEIITSTPKRSASRANSRWFSFAKKSRPNWRMDRRSVELIGVFRFRMLRWILITRMSQPNEWVRVVRLRIVKNR